MATKFQTVVVDAPWPIKDRLPWGGAASHYGLMTVQDILEYVKTFDNRLAPDCRLFMWRLASMPMEALDIVTHWGFKPKTEIVWIKQTTQGNRWFGMGRTVRAEHETCIIATRGRPAVLNHSVRSTFSAKVWRHSSKPDAFYQIVESLSPGPYLELFSRQDRPGWTCVGDEGN